MLVTAHFERHREGVQGLGYWWRTSGAYLPIFFPCYLPDFKLLGHNVFFLSPPFPPPPRKKLVRFPEGRGRLTHGYYYEAAFVLSSIRCGRACVAGGCWLVGWFLGCLSLSLSLLSVSCVVDREGSECGVSECVIQVVCRVTFYHHRLCHPASDDFTRFFLVVKFSRYSTFRLVV